MKRFFDLILSTLLLFTFVIPIIVIALCIKITSIGPAIYWSKRIGRNGFIFKMPKFRTMKLNTPSLATHLLLNPNDYLSPIGGFLRKTSLDELPQLFSIIKGDMSFVGPRPALFNQKDLIELRTLKGVDHLLPGVTGWAQINGRDKLSISEKVELDLEYMNKKSFWFDLNILLSTFIIVIKGQGVAH